MKAFTQLLQQLEATSEPEEKLRVLAAYFRAVPPADAAWALHLLLGRTLPRLATSRQLRAWATAEAGLPDWIVEDCYEAAGDWAETIALLLPPNPTGSAAPLHRLIEEQWLPSARLSDAERRPRLLLTWRELDSPQSFLWNKLITRSFRPDLPPILIAHALSRCSRLSTALISLRLAGPWKPTPQDYQRLLAPEPTPVHPAQPYPFLLAEPLELSPDSLGHPHQWQVEWKWDGLRTQLVHRHGHTALWSRAEESLSHLLPELVAAGSALPDGTVLDGHVVAWDAAGAAPSSRLQPRLSAKRRRTHPRLHPPVRFVACDLLEENFEDLRSLPLARRRSRLEGLLARALHSPTPPTVATSSQGPPAPAQGELFGDQTQTSPPPLLRAPPIPLLLSPRLEVETWTDLIKLHAAARLHRAQGLMLKLKSSPYDVDRARGAWWEWNAPPLRINAVLIAGQAEAPRRTKLCTRYTLALWHHEQLVPVTQARAMLPQEELEQLDAFVREHTLQRFGPVRSVRPELVFELAFDAVASSKRHRCGLVLRCPRITRWCRDQQAAQAGRLESLIQLLDQ